jgi:arabinose-5-phosphate isomerase
MPAALNVALEVLRHEATALAQLSQRLSPGFAEVLQALWCCRGQVVVTGVGKSGHVGRKAAATLASVGVRATFMHATEAVHGDLGVLGPDDVLLALSFSGASKEIVEVMAAARAFGAPLLALTGAAGSPLAQGAQAACVIGPLAEACPLKLVPTTSTTAMLAITDAWAMALLTLTEQTQVDYGRRHPAGALGQAVKQVAQVMRQGAHNPIAHQGQPVRAVLQVMSQTPGRPGAASIVDDQGTLVGLFTDGDLRRLALSAPLDVDAAIGTLMHRAPKTVRPTDLVQTAMAVLQEHAVDQLPVVDAQRRPVGLLDIHDVLPRS